MIYSSLQGPLAKGWYVLAGFLIIFSSDTFSFCQAVRSVEIRGTVLDQMAKPVATPKVVFISGLRNTACLSGPDGSFVCQVSPDKNFTLEITASVFALYECSSYTVRDWPRDAEFRLA